MFLLVFLVELKWICCDNETLKIKTFISESSCKILTYNTSPSLPIVFSSSCFSSSFSSRPSASPSPSSPSPSAPGCEFPNLAVASVAEKEQSLVFNSPRESDWYTATRTHNSFHGRNVISLIMYREDSVGLGIWKEPKQKGGKKNSSRCEKTPLIRVVKLFIWENIN